MKTQNTGTKAQIKTEITNIQKHKCFGFFVFDKFVFYLCFVSLGFVLFGASPIFASVADSQPGIDLTIQDVMGIITSLACWITRAALVLVVIAVVYFGVKFMMSQGDPTKLTEARKSFLWGLVGIAVILGTYTIIATVANALGADYTLFLPLSC